MEIIELKSDKYYMLYMNQFTGQNTAEHLKKTKHMKLTASWNGNVKPPGSPTINIKHDLFPGKEETLNKTTGMEMSLLVWLVSMLVMMEKCKNQEHNQGNVQESLLP